MGAATGGGPEERERPLEIDFSRRFVRVTNRRPDGFVEFDFALGDPELFVELVLNEEAFAAFRDENRAVPFPEPVAGDAGAADPEAGDATDWGWRLADARETRFR